MSISPLYVPLFTIEEVILDKDTGLPLSGGVVRFFRDSQRATAKPVYQLTGSPPDYSFSSVGTELTLGISGTFVDDDGNPFVPYALPYDANGAVDLYYITVESEGGVSQFDREAVPYLGEGIIPPEQLVNTENELSNPQFVEVNFPTSGTTTISVTGSNTVTPIAPGWDIISSGTGDIDVEQLDPTAEGVVTNPPYALRIEADATLGATITLRQRLTNSPSIFRNNYASGTLTAAVISGGGSSVSMVYSPSTGSDDVTIIPNTAIPTDGAYHKIPSSSETGFAAIPDFTNTAASSGYVDILISIPTARNIAITSLQIVGLLYEANIPFDEQTGARQKDHLFHYYEDAVVHQPKSSLLAGWNFGLNPWQFRSTTLSNVANNTYTADQTVIIQQAYVTSTTANNVAVGRASHTANYAFQIQAVTATNKVMMINYIDPATIRPYWGRTLSARLRGSITTTNGTTPTFKVRLMWKDGLPTTPMTQTAPVASWDAAADSLPSVTADGWTYLSATNDPTYTFTGSMTEFDFNGFVLPASTNANMTLAVTFIMMDALDETGTADVLNIEEISVVANDFAISVQPDTFDDSLSKCQYYYQKTFNNSVIPASSAGNENAITYRLANATGTQGGALWEFKTIMRSTTPSITTYNPSAAGSAWYNASQTASSGVATAIRIGDSRVFINNNQNAGTDAAGDVVDIQATADARLGV